MDRFLEGLRCGNRNVWRVELVPALNKVAALSKHYEVGVVRGICVVLVRLTNPLNDLIGARDNVALGKG